MLNLDETIDVILNYSSQRDSFLKLTKQFGTIISFVEILRSQVSEINLLQLIPGFYLLLLFFSFLFLYFSSDFILFVIIEKDFQKKLGIKTISKKKSIGSLIAQFFLFSIILGLILNTVIPIGLDSFNNYDETTLEDLWSFEEVLNLELTLLTILTILSQFPVFIIKYLTTERDQKYFLGFGKNLSFISFLIAGILTPTIDGYTQVTFALSILFLYSLIFYYIQRNLDIQYLLFNN